MKVHLGCGPQFVEGWVNVDYSFGARVARTPVVGRLARAAGLFGVDWNPHIQVHDLTQPLPWEDRSVAFIYSSHTLEHLRREDGEALVRECARVLEPGGVLRIAVPDLERSVRAYKDGRLPADRFVDSLGVLAESRRSLARRLIALFDDGHTHKCMYDHASLTRLMTQCGFRAARASPFESWIPDIDNIEQRDRAVGSVVVEGVKPAS